MRSRRESHDIDDAGEEMSLLVRCHLAPLSVRGTGEEGEMSAPAWAAPRYTRVFSVHAPTSELGGEASARPSDVGIAVGRVFDNIGDESMAWEPGKPEAQGYYVFALPNAVIPRPQ